MNQKALNALEYPKIIEKLTDKASSYMGKQLCKNLEPSTDLEEIRLMQIQTKDALTRLFQKGSVSFGNVKDVRGSLKRLEIGSSLGIQEILAICALLENTSRVKAYSRKERNDLPVDSLDGMFDALSPLTPLSAEIRRCIISEDEFSDDASPALRQIRRNMKITNDRIHTQLASLVNGGARTYLQDSVITMRNGRYCIPVKAEYKGQVPGMIHDQSSTGSTLFIEPMSVVKLNNDIRELELQEQKEIEVILADLSQQIALEQETISLNLKIMVQLDFIFARAALAMDMNASEPIFNDEGRINLKKARHPLINKKNVVPIDIRLGDTFDLLVITGPNTGGKTVSLKTVGLLTLMGQSGLHIPTLDRSELALFHEVYADIGDEQSIEQSLSTFSSHMTNIVSFLDKADRHSLVLFDELCSGTDPTEGAALAISILSYLHERGIRTMATTHYSELKIFALSASGVENACCEFDVETLSPTYRLLIGIPGKSNAFAISSKLGIPQSIIEKAKEQINEQDESFEDVLTSLEESRVTIENERTEIAQYKQEIETLKKQLESKQEKLDVQKDRIIRQANEEAHKVLQEAKDYADQTMKLFHKFHNDYVDTAAVERERQKLRQKLNKTEQKMSQPAAKKKPKKELTAKDVRPGDTVRVLSMNLKGTISTRPDSKGYLFVQMGIIRSKVHISDLELIDEPVITTPSLSRTGAGKIRMSKSASVSTEINLLGKTVDEAIAELDKYLDDAYIAHLKTVRIVHGKGTGALRKGVHNYLKRQKHVASYRLGEFGEGDAGVTIVEFKNNRKANTMVTKQKILIVDDDNNIAELISLYLTKECFETRIVNDGEQALKEFNTFHPDLILLDLMLPGIDGYQVCREIRHNSDVPIIMLSAKGETFDKVLGLELGADDYIIKPFDTKELVARVRAVLRRFQVKQPSPSSSEKCVTYPDLTVNLTNYAVTYMGRQVDMPPKELELLYFLAASPNQVFTREQLLDHIWGYEYIGDTRTVDVHIKRLREKIKDNPHWSIATVWGIGYKFEVKNP